MKVVHLLPVGRIDAGLLEFLREAIPNRLGVECTILPFHLDPAPSYHAERQQFHSSEILQRSARLVRSQDWRFFAVAESADWRFLAVADVDLYIPILEYVFGEAQLGGPCALVSTFRLRQEFYGLERDDALVGERLLKESIHELGHTLDLRHCPDYRCVMASSHAVEWIDLRQSTLCPHCQSRMESGGGRSHHKSALP